MVRYVHLRAIEHHFDTLREEWGRSVAMGVDGVVSDYQQHIPGNEVGGVIGGATARMQTDLRNIVTQILAKYREIAGELDRHDREVLIDHGKSMLKKYMSAVRTVTEQKASEYGVAQQVKDRGQDLETSINGYYRAATERLGDGLTEILAASAAEPVTEGSGGTVSNEILQIQSNEQHQEILAKFEHLEELIRGKNEIDLNGDVGRVYAEITATQRILLGPSVRRSVVDTLIIPALKWLAEKFTDEAVGLLANTLLALVLKYFGIELPG